jgi:hypothetical protein
LPVSDAALDRFIYRPAWETPERIVTSLHSSPENGKDGFDGKRGSPAKEGRRRTRMVLCPAMYQIEHSGRGQRSPPNPGDNHCRRLDPPCFTLRPSLA